jgi:prepilin-type N-terminal cleavage/methylation domain-containing protein
MKKPLDSKGFTLVELAIVIVIIGLLVGGVLAGQELINQARIQNILKTVESYKAAVITFKGKYNDVPGDSLRPDLFFPGAGITQGNGNGIIDLRPEAFEFWKSLSLAKLVKGSYTGYTGNDAINANNMPVDAGGINYIFRCTPGSIHNGKPYMKDSCWFTANKISTTSVINSIGSAIFSLEDAKALDMKIDDGVASTGTLLGTGPSITRTICSGTDPFADGVITGDYLQTGDLARVVCVPYFEFRP